MLPDSHFHTMLPPTSFYTHKRAKLLHFRDIRIINLQFVQQDRTKNAQFVIISLRSNMFELADRLVGIYKTYDCTKSVTINPQSYGLQARETGDNAEREPTESVEES